jgi:hypothetical protein
MADLESSENSLYFSFSMERKFHTRETVKAAVTLDEK